MTSERRIPTRMGDGELVHLTRSEIRADLEEGTAAAARRAKVPPLAQDELDHLLDIYGSPARFTGVDIGSEVVLSYDGSGMKTIASRRQDLQVYEQWFGADTVELHHVDYSFKPVKAIVPFEAQEMHEVLLRVVAPVQYGAQPNLGLYSQPDGPVPNWSELLPLGRIAEARTAQEEAVPMAVKDMVYVCEAMWEAGADGVDFDTAAAAGDADFQATLLATAEVRRRCPGLGIEIGMSGEFVLGMHGEVEYDGVRLAGLWPAEQMKLAAKAGATIFGPVVNVNASKSCAWNIARTCTIVKPCVEQATIPIHVNVGMGVGGVCMTKYPPVDAVSRASRACVDILKVDGLQVGSGDAYGMPCAHTMASGMGGMRTAGDLVGRLQMTRGMRLPEAKKYVADRLGVTPADLSDPVLMNELREQLGLGRITTFEISHPTQAVAIESKFNVEEVLGVPVNSVRRFEERTAGARGAVRP